MFILDMFGSTTPRSSRSQQRRQHVASSGGDLSQSNQTPSPAALVVPRAACLPVTRRPSSRLDLNSASARGPRPATTCPVLPRPSISPSTCHSPLPPQPDPRHREPPWPLLHPIPHTITMCRSATCATCGISSPPPRLRRPALTRRARRQENLVRLRQPHRDGARRRRGGGALRVRAQGGQGRGEVAAHGGVRWRRWDGTQTT